MRAAVQAQARFPSCVALWIRNAQGVPFADTQGMPVVWWIGPPRSELPADDDGDWRVARGRKPARRGFVERLACFVHGWEGMIDQEGLDVVCCSHQVMGTLQLAPYVRAQLVTTIEQLERDGILPQGGLK